MGIKSRIIIGIVFIFAQLLTVSIYSLHHSYQLARMGQSLYADNSRSIQYCENILQAAEAIQRSNGTGIADYVKIIDRNIGYEESNITEKGEIELVKSVRAEFEKYHSLYLADRDASRMILRRIVDDVHAISMLNIKAIEKTNDRIGSYEMKYYIALSIIATVCILVSVVFIFNFFDYVGKTEVKFLKTELTDLNSMINRDRK